MFTVEMQTRNFDISLATQQAKLEPIWYAWHAIGGPESATIRVVGPESSLWDVLTWLRRPLTIYSFGQPVWWGFVARAQVRVGGIQVSASLDEMVNRVRYRYTSSGTDYWTSWAAESDLYNEYGYRERAEHIGEATQAAAENYRDTTLVALMAPVPEVSFNSADGAEALLSCRGWWQTLGWQFYDNAGTSQVATTTQISTIVGAKGQFVDDVEVIDASGVNDIETQDGLSTTLEIVSDLLAIGTSSNKRLLATVTPQRILQVYEEPASSEVPYRLNGNGELRGSLDQRLLTGTCPAGVWVDLSGSLPVHIGGSFLAPVSPVFIERCEFDVSSGRLYPEPRAVQGPWSRLAG